MGVDAIGSGSKVERVERPDREESKPEEASSERETDTTDRVELDSSVEDEEAPGELLKGMGDNYQPDEPDKFEPPSTYDPETGIITTLNPDGSVFGQHQPSSGRTTINWGEKGEPRSNADLIHEHEPLTQAERDKWLHDQTKDLPLGSSTGPDGSDITEYEDRTEIKQPDGTSITRKKDGSEEIIRPDGPREKVRPDGQREIHYPNGSGEIIKPDGTRERIPGAIENPDGSIQPYPLPEEIQSGPSNQPLSLPVPQPRPTTGDGPLPVPPRQPDGPVLKYPPLPDGPLPAPPRQPDGPVPTPPRLPDGPVLIQPSIGPFTAAPLVRFP